MNRFSEQELQDREERDRRYSREVNRELIRIGVANAMEAAEWLTRQSGGRLRVAVSPFFCGDKDEGPILAVAAHSYPSEDELLEKEFEDYAEFPVGTPPSRIRQHMEYLLDGWRAAVKDKRP